MRTTDKIDRIEATEERQRRELTDRLALLGTIAGGIAHELNNPLGYTTQALTALARAVETNNPERAREALAIAIEGVGRIETLAGCLMSALQPPTNGKPADVTGAIGDSIKLAETQIRQCARLVLDLAPGVLVPVDKGRLIQIFLPLLMNAAQAIGEGKPDTNTITVRAKLDARSFAVVEIEDTGRGIPTAAQRYIFQPFYSTKPAGKGTGIGLFVCAELVCSLGGEITFQSTEGRGATFRVSLPTLAPARAPMGSDPESGVVARGKRSGTVLVVDDDADMAETVRDCIPRNHRVDVTTDPLYALARLRARIPYDLILCDVQMPGMSGIDLHRRACELDGNPGARFVFMTGGSEPLTYAQERGIEVLRKPFNAEQMSAIVASRIGALPGALNL